MKHTMTSSGAGAAVAARYLPITVILAVLLSSAPPRVAGCGPSDDLAAMLSSLTPDQQKADAATMLSSPLTPEQQKDADAAAILSSLTPEQQKEMGCYSPRKRSVRCMLDIHKSLDQHISGCHAHLRAAHNLTDAEMEAWVHNESSSVFNHAQQSPSAAGRGVLKMAHLDRGDHSLVTMAMHAAELEPNTLHVHWTCGFKNPEACNKTIPYEDVPADFPCGVSDEHGDARNMTGHYCIIWPGNYSDDEGEIQVYGHAKIDHHDPGTSMTRHLLQYQQTSYSSTPRTVHVGPQSLNSYKAANTQYEAANLQATNQYVSAVSNGQYYMDNAGNSMLRSMYPSQLDTLGTAGAGAYGVQSNPYTGYSGYASPATQSYNGYYGGGYANYYPSPTPNRMGGVGYSGNYDAVYDPRVSSYQYTGINHYAG